MMMRATTGLRVSSSCCNKALHHRRAVGSLRARQHVCRVAHPSGLPEDNGAVFVRDDLTELLEVLPNDIRQPLAAHPQRGNLLEVVLDLGRRPEARFLGQDGGIPLRDAEISWEDLRVAETKLGAFGLDNRAGIEGTLHRISAIRNRKGTIIGLTCRVGRAVTGHVDMIRDVIKGPNSMLFLGRPGVGKTTVIRELARVLADELQKRVVIVDTSNEIGGDGDVPHPAIGGARRMQVPDPSRQHHVMIEAVENHMPEVIIVDEVGTELEAMACRTIAERGVQLISTAHGVVLENLIKNPMLSDMVGGITSVTLGDEEARARGCQKTVLERKQLPTFPVVVEMRERNMWVLHWVEDSVDKLLLGKMPMVQVRQRHSAPEPSVVVQELSYDQVDGILSKLPSDEYDVQYGRSIVNRMEEIDMANMSAGAFGWAERLRDLSDQDGLKEVMNMRARKNAGARGFNGVTALAATGSKQKGKRR